MHKLLSCLRDSISGWLDGFDRLAFVGHLMPLMMPGAADEFFDGRKILRRDATAWMQTQTKSLEETVASQVEAATGFRVTYLRSTKDSKEEAARMRQQELGISDGLIGAWSCVEPCRSIRMVGGVGAPTLIPIQTQCKHLYVYQIHPIWGFMHTRIQTWFPYRIQVVINGREWLARQLDEAGISYARSGNKFISIADDARARQFQAQQVATPWWTELNKLLPVAFPTMEQTVGPHLGYTWINWQSEWATDLLFDDAATLADVSQRMMQYAFATGDSARLIRFFNRPGMIGKSGAIRNNAMPQLQTKMKDYPDGMRIRHWFNGNSIKMYTEFNVLRFETTINQPDDFRVYRHKQGADKKGPKELLPLRKGVADMAPRAEISRRINGAYMDHVAAANDNETKLHDMLAPYLRTRTKQGRRVRALSPFGKDRTLLTLIADPQFLISGCSNKVLRDRLKNDQRYRGKTEKQLSGIITRAIRLLRDHGILHKIPSRRRYRVSPEGRTLVNALTAALSASTKELAKQAA